MYQTAVQQEGGHDEYGLALRALHDVSVKQQQQPVQWPFIKHNPGEPVPEKNIHSITLSHRHCRYYTRYLINFLHFLCFMASFLHICLA